MNALLDLGAASRMLRDALRDGEVAPTWIYFIQAGGHTGPIKIGAALNPVRRMANLQVGNHEGLRLLGAYRGLPIEEKQIHDEYRGSRIHGEWFSYSARLLNDIERLCLPVSFFYEAAK